jgi:sigma-B regulation protein RsbU (phosphoserine phosphatase)
MRILIAEDDPVSRLVLTTNLVNWGHEVVTAVNGLDALRASQAEDAPRLAILDWMMPEMEGPDVCRRMRESPAIIPPYIIMLTARQGAKEVVEAMQAGADDYLTKPYHRDELRVRVQVGVRMIELQTKLADRIGKLEEALDRVKRLQGIIPICGYCKKVRDDEDYWQNVESYIATHSEAEFSHGVCPSCFTQVVEPQLESYKASLPSPKITNHA